MAMTEDVTGPATWLTLTEAAERLGVRRELLRSRARRGLIPSQRNNRGEMLVQVQPGYDLAMTRPAAMPATGLEEDLTELKAELTESRVAQARAEERAAALREMLDREQGRTTRLEEEIRDLRRPWWRRWLG
jgi:chromosome segregation ATPase